MQLTRHQALELIKVLHAHGDLNSVVSDLQYDLERYVLGDGPQEDDDEEEQHIISSAQVPAAGFDEEDAAKAQQRCEAPNQHGSGAWEQHPRFRAWVRGQHRKLRSQLESVVDDAILPRKRRPLRYR
jgi:hypothetical protein